ncbi:MAG: siderophore-interacting protein [Pseudomonadota bacterium]
MALLDGIKNTARKMAGRPGPRILTVDQAWHLTPNMIRVTFRGPELDGFPTGREGGNCKLMIPDVGETKQAFANRLADGPAPVRRTYTVRAFDAAHQTLTIDFVDHGDNGPASAWAGRAQPGDFLGFAGPSQPKVTQFDADWYVVAADPSAIPVAAATLEAMPRTAKGIAIFEIPTAADQQTINAPAGIDMHWLIHPTPHVPSTAQEDLIRSLNWPTGRVQTCIAGESGVIKSLRAFLHREQGVPRADTYISGYWKIGLIEDEHQAMKRAEG